MVECAASLLTSVFSQIAAGSRIEERGSNTLDGGAPWYSAYETAEGAFVCIGAIEPRFYSELLRVVGLADEHLPPQLIATDGPCCANASLASSRPRRARSGGRFSKAPTRASHPFSRPSEAPQHPHNQARGTFIEVGRYHTASSDAELQSLPAKRQERTGVLPGSTPDEVLSAWGFADEELEALRRAAAIR